MGDNDQTVKFGYGLLSLEYMGNHPKKFALLIVALIAIAGLYFSENINNLYQRQVKSEYFEQYDNVTTQHDYVRKVTDKWDNIKSMDEDTNDVDFVRQNIHTALAYTDLKTDKLDLAMQVVWLWHSAKLKVIEADITNEYRVIGDALTSLTQAEALIKESKKKPKDIKFLNDKNYGYRIKRTKLNVFALAYHIKSLPEDKADADKLLKIIGGCEKLRKQSTEHRKILTSLGCFEGRYMADI